MKIDGTKLREELAKKELHLSRVSKELGYSVSWLGWCIKHNAMADSAASKLASKLNIKISDFEYTGDSPKPVRYKSKVYPKKAKAFDVSVDDFYEALKKHDVGDSIRAMSLKMGYGKNSLSNALTNGRMSVPMSFIIKNIYGIEPEEYELKVEEPVQEEQPVEEAPAPVQSVDLTEVMKALESIESRLGTMNGDYEASYEKLKRIAELEEKQLEAMEGMSNILREELKHIRRGVEYLVRVWEK